MNTIVVTRWEKSVPDYDGGQLNHLITTTHKPPKSEGWQKVCVKVFPGQLEYISKERW